MSTPFFPDWSQGFQQEARKFSRLSQSSLHQLQLICAPWIPAHLFAQADDQAFSRVRLWPFQLTVWSFLWQVSQAGAACRDAVRQAIVLCRLQNQPVPSEKTPAYCLARAKLPMDRLESIHRELVKNAESHIQERDLWCGLRVTILDGTCFTMEDTEENQALYPQLKAQKPGCGSPIAKLLACFSLATGMITDWVLGNHHQHELALLPKLLEHLRAGDVASGDRGFGNYPCLAQCLHRGIHAVFRANTAKRKIDFRKGKRLGPQDYLMTWKKGAVCPAYLTAEAWAELPESIEVRVVRVQAKIRGFRTQSLLLVTTLLDPVKYPAIELGNLYRRRWQVEICFRHIKCTLQMDHLSCRTPEMVERELRMHLLIHNIVRRMGLEASRRHGIRLERISFAGTVAVLHSFGEGLLQARSRKARQELGEEMYRIIAADVVPLRPGRREPRAIKRRPKPFPLLTSHRRAYKEILHRNRYRAGKNSNK